MKKQALALITATAITLAAASPAFAGGRHHNRHHNKNGGNTNINVTQVIKVIQKGYKNIANISANINIGH